VKSVITPALSFSAVVPTKAPSVDWWSLARKTAGPKGVSNEMPSAAAMSLSVSVDLAFFRMAAAASISV
jgi:hypothetical protein